jgi:hypothetical protein
MCVLVIVAIGSLAGVAVVAGGAGGGAAFVSTRDRVQGDASLIATVEDATTTTAEIAATTVAEQEVPTTVTTTKEAVAAVTTSTTEPGLVTSGFHDLPDVRGPTGFEVLERWTDGPSRVTVWASPSLENIRADVEAEVLVGLQQWVTIESGIFGETMWARMIHGSHPWCVLVEVYTPGPGREKAARAADLLGQQILIVETPYCGAEPGGFA